MNIAVIFAGGTGQRMNTASKPKQFLELHGKPIIIYTLEYFQKHSQIDGIVVVCLESWIDYCENLLKKYQIDKVLKIVPGGNSGQESIFNGLEAAYQISDNEQDIVLIHDGVRPFVTPRILNDSIEAAKKYGASVAAVAVSDTLLISENGDKVDEIPPRKLYYKGQAPDTFKLKLFISLLEKITPEDRKKITGTSQVCTLNNYPIYMVKGDDINFKITTKSDFIIAESLVKERDNND